MLLALAKAKSLAIGIQVDLQPELPVMSWVQSTPPSYNARWAQQPSIVRLK